MKRNDSQTIKDKMKILVEESGRSITSLAKEIDIPQKTLYNQVVGSTAIGVDTLLSLIEVLKLDLSEITGLPLTNKTDVTSVAGLNTEANELTLRANSYVPLYALHRNMQLSEAFERKLKPIEWVRIPYVDCDGAIEMKSDSMTPVINRGDLMIYKVMDKNDFILSDALCIIGFKKDDKYFTAVRYIKTDVDDENKLFLYSAQNPTEMRPIDRSEIEDLAYVSATINYINSM